MKNKNIINQLIKELAKRVSSRIYKRSTKRKYKRKISKNYKKLAYDLDMPELVQNVSQSRMDHLRNMNFNGQLERMNELKNNLMDINKQISEYEGKEPLAVSEENKNEIFNRDQDMMKLNLSKNKLENELSMMKSGFMFGATDPLTRSVPYGNTGAFKSGIPGIFDPRSIQTGGLNYDPLKDGVGDKDISKFLNSNY